VHYLNDEGLKLHSNGVKDVIFKTLLFLNSRCLFILEILFGSFCLRSSRSSRTLFMDSLQRSEYNALWSICICFFYFRNIGPFSLWTLSFESLILIASFHDSFTFAYLTRELDLWERDVCFNKLKWCRYALLFGDPFLKDIWHVPWWLSSKVIKEFEHLCFPFFVFLEKESWSQPYYISWVVLRCHGHIN